jgi:hypothetical protein
VGSHRRDRSCDQKVSLTPSLFFASSFDLQSATAFVFSDLYLVGFFGLALLPISFVSTLSFGKPCRFFFLVPLFNSSSSCLI